MKNAILLLAVTAITVGCENVDQHMHDQPSVRVEKALLIPPPAGVVPALGTVVKTDYSSVDGVTLTAPYALEAESAARGKALYNVYCMPCHGETGKANTRIALKMDVTPFDVVQDSTKALTDGEIFVKIVASQGLMPNYRNELEDNEAWDVVAYVRSLQQTK